MLSVLHVVIVLFFVIRQYYSLSLIFQYALPSICCGWRIPLVSFCCCWHHFGGRFIVNVFCSVISFVIIIAVSIVHTMVVLWSYIFFQSPIQYALPLFVVVEGFHCIIFVVVVVVESSVLLLLYCVVCHRLALPSSYISACSFD